MEERIHQACQTAVAELPYNTPINDLMDAVVIQIGFDAYDANKWQIRRELKKLRYG